MRAPPLQKARGAATVELALVLPLFVGLILVSIFLTELVRAKLKVQEATRYAAWEMTAFALSDYGGARHDVAFEEARTRTLEDVTARFGDYDSVEDNAPPPTFVLQPGRTTFEVVSRDVPNSDTPVVLGDNLGPAVDAVLGGSGWIAEQFRFNRAGQVEVRTQSSVRNLLVPRLRTTLSRDEEGADLSSFALSDRYTLVASGWHLPDGADATVQGRRSGRHVGGSEHGLYTQVRRMSFLGVKDRLSGFAGFEQLGGLLNRIGPALTGTFVVSHAYGDTARPDDFDADRNCNLPSHPATTGVRNVREEPLTTNGRPLLDHEYMRCFDTTPFRDTHRYASSMSIQQFEARGRYFMGCKKPQADDPTRDSDYGSDVHEGKTVCLDP